MNQVIVDSLQAHVDYQDKTTQRLITQLAEAPLGSKEVNQLSRLINDSMKQRDFLNQWRTEADKLMRQDMDPSQPTRVKR